MQDTRSDERSNARQDNPDNPDFGELAYRRLAAELTLTQSAPAQTGTTGLGTCYNNVTHEYAQSHLLKEHLP
jgi:phage gp29-like protein